MPAITSLVAIAGVASSIGGVVLAASQASAQAKMAKEQARKAEQILRAKKPDTKTRAEIKLASKDKNLKRGKGSLAQRNRRKAIETGGLDVPSASEVGGL